MHRTPRFDSVPTAPLPLAATAALLAACLLASTPVSAQSDPSGTGSGIACTWDTALGNPGGSLNSIGLWNDDLYIGGSAGSDFNGVTAGVAVTDLDAGTTSPLGTTALTDGFITGFVPYDPGGGETLYVLGSFNSIESGGSEIPDSRGVFAWDGTTAGALAGSPFAEPLVFAQQGTVFQDQLVIGGAGGAVDPPQLPVLTFWDGSAWTTYRNEFEGLVAPVILDVAVHDGDLYFGGRFDRIRIPDGDGEIVTESQNIMGFDGESFFSVDGGLKRASSPISQVLALETFNDGTGDALYIGGRFDSAADDTPMFAVAKWDGTELQAVGNGFPMPTEVRDFAVFDDGAGPALYAVGNFIEDTDGTPIQRLAKLENGEWIEVAGGIGENPNRVLSLPDGTLGFAGSFTQVGANGDTPGAGAASGFAQLACAADLTITPPTFDFGAIDPAGTDSTIFTLTNASDAAITISGIDLSGDPQFAPGGVNSCDAATLAPAESCEIEVVLDPGGQIGEWSAGLAVTSDANDVNGLITGSAVAGAGGATAVPALNKLSLALLAGLLLIAGLVRARA